MFTHLRLPDSSELASNRSTGARRPYARKFDTRPKTADYSAHRDPASRREKTSVRAALRKNGLLAVIADIATKLVYEISTPPIHRYTKSCAALLRIDGHPASHVSSTAWTRRGGWGPGNYSGSPCRGAAIEDCAGTLSVASASDSTCHPTSPGATGPSGPAFTKATRLREQQERAREVELLSQL